MLIDFGLSYNSKLPEDKGVDLYVLERALTSAHSHLDGLFDAIMAAYKKHSRQWSATFNRFAEGEGHGAGFSGWVGDGRGDVHAHALVWSLGARCVRRPSSLTSCLSLQ